MFCAVRKILPRPFLRSRWLLAGPTLGHDRSDEHEAEQHVCTVLKHLQSHTTVAVATMQGLVDQLLHILRRMVRQVG